MYANMSSFDQHYLSPIMTSNKVYSSTSSSFSSVSSLRKTKNVFKKVLKKLAPEVCAESAPYVYIARAH